MTSPSHLKPFQSPHAFPMRTTSSHPSSTLISMKLKTLVHNFIFSQLFRIARTITKAKSLLIEVLKEIQLHLHFIEHFIKKNKSRNKNKLFFGSFRLHYNWCSNSHVVPVPSPLSGFPANHQTYYDSTWTSVISTTKCDIDIAESQLAGYLQWLEEEARDNPGTHDVNEIDQLADKFIANCHEKFRLEKVESYRRFQEMMARSV